MSDENKNPITFQLERFIELQRKRQIEAWKFKFHEILRAMVDEMLLTHQPEFYIQKLRKVFSNELDQWAEETLIKNQHIECILFKLHQKTPNQPTTTKCAICDNTDNVTSSGLCLPCQKAVKSISTKQKRKPKQTP